MLVGQGSPPRYGRGVSPVWGSSHNQRPCGITHGWYDVQQGAPLPSPCHEPTRASIQGDGVHKVPTRALGLFKQATADRDGLDQMHSKTGSSGDWEDQEEHYTVPEMKIALEQHMKEILSLAKNKKKQKMEPETATTKSDRSSSIHLGPLTALFDRSLGVIRSLPSLESLLVEDAAEQDLSGEAWKVLAHVICDISIRRTWEGVGCPRLQPNNSIKLFYRSVPGACTVALSIGLQSWPYH